ncbi:MAG: Ppx/GppA family phosphatase [Demequina sp.]|jgi:exopolyphosphatase/guanosine-5'-triphosphate,3'-diphosphate pyrophosphatase|nr:Ppx/GppA family phosphatase [Demequina sp.]
MTRVAAIDCGTNSIRLLVADAVDGRLVDLTREMRVVKLGQGVDKTGEFAAEALERTFAVLDDYAETCRALEVDRIRFVATSATRDARNREVFLSGVRERIGVTPEVISGHEEASLSFRGVVSAVSDAPGPYLVVDLGGGSTELALGSGERGVIELSAAYSMDVGCVRLTERHLVSNPPTPQQQAAAVADVRAALAVAVQTVPIGDTATLIGVAGSITTVTANALGLDHYDPVAIHGSVLPLEAVVASCNQLIAATYAERAAMPFMHPGRVEAIGAGALVWREVVTAVAEAVAASGRVLTTVTTSEHDILDGIALSIA